MHRKKGPVPRDQKAHEAATGRGFLLWIGVYLVLTLVFLIFDHPGAHHAIAGHHVGDPAAASPPQVEATPDHSSAIARGP